MLDEVDVVEIKRIICEISEDSHPEWNVEAAFEYWRNKYSSFAEDYPKLFNAAVKKVLPLKYLDMMLQQVEMLKTKSKSVEEADTLVYSALRQEYVDPMIEKLTPAERVEFNKKIQEEMGSM